MAVTKIKPIRGTVNKALAYILDPAKTDDQLYVSSFGCAASDAAAKEFEWTRNLAAQQGMQMPKVIARHLIQSFDIGEVTPEMAHEIGKQFADEWLKGKYEYVIATHIDKGHCHNHIIFNAINFVDYHAYRSNKRTYREMRQLSDEICKEHGLSVIPPSQSKGMDYKEYTEAKRGTSWKQKLKQTIDRCIITAKDYDEFLKLMQEAGYEIKTGKYISFRAEGQERFTRAKTIGDNYTEERIKERIQGRGNRKRQMQTSRRGISLISDIQERIQLIGSKGYEHYRTTILYDNGPDQPFIDHGTEPVPGWPIEGCAAVPVIHETLGVGEAVVIGVLLQDGFLVQNGIAVPLQFIVTGEAAVQSGNFLVCFRLSVGIHDVPPFRQPSSGTSYSLYTATISSVRMLFSDKFLCHGE